MIQTIRLQTKHISTAPHRGWGVYIARVTYQNGDVEYLGSGHIEFVKSGEKPIAQGIYYFPGDAFDKLFLEYAGDFKHLGHEDDTPVSSNPKSQT